MAIFVRMKSVVGWGQAATATTTNVVLIPGSGYTLEKAALSADVNIVAKSNCTRTVPS